jgi:hypothetical protein
MEEDAGPEAMATVDDAGTVAPKRSKNQRRRAAKKRKEKENNCTTGHLSNKRWRHLCGRDTQQQQDKERKIQDLLRADRRGDVTYEEAVQKLGTAPANVSTYAAYLQHATVRFVTMAAMEKRMRLKAPRQNRLDAYGKELQAAKKVALELIAGRTGSILMVWGDGSFRSSGPGHAPAPNKRLQKLLSKHIPIVTCSEYKTSQMSPCHPVHLRDGPPKDGKRVELKICPTCNTHYGRDYASAMCIREIFEHQCENGDRTRPEKYQ